MRRVSWQKVGPYLIFLAAMLWATDAPFRVRLTEGLPTSFIVLAEHFIDVLIVLPILLINVGKLKSLSTKQWLAVLVIAVGGSALATLAFTQAFHYMNPSVAILLQKLQPLIAISLAASLLRERMTRYFWPWAILAMVGAYIISFPNLVPQLYVGEQFNPSLIGVLLALIAASLWGASTVLGRLVLKTVDFKVVTSLRFTVAFVFLLIWNFVSQDIFRLNTLTSRDLLFIIIVALVSGVTSLFIYYRGLQFTKASIATLLELGFPLAAVVVNTIFLKAVLSPMQLLGMAVLLYSVLQLGSLNTAETDELTPLPVRA